MPIPEQQAKTSEGWTAGDWELAKIHTAGIYDNDGSAKILCYAGETIIHIASVSAAAPFKRGQGSNLQDPVRDARSRLIAASPDLYEALQEIADESVFNQQRFAEDTDTDYFLRCFKAVKDRARTALSKARGE